jgi:hypothetical protein
MSHATLQQYVAEWLALRASAVEPDATKPFVLTDEQCKAVDETSECMEQA